MLAVTLQVSARTICMQFEGHSTAVSDIVVDAVGKYAYTISSPHTEELPVIMDVALEERTKVKREMKCLHEHIMCQHCLPLQPTPQCGLACCRCLQCTPMCGSRITPAMRCR